MIFVVCVCSISATIKLTFIFASPTFLAVITPFVSTVAKSIFNASNIGFECVSVKYSNCRANVSLGVSVTSLALIEKPIALMLLDIHNNQLLLVV